jgi:catechol 2,3-dioxygenase-like lactoylglutathione lyase family enzyme
VAVSRIARFSLMTAQPRRLEDFYCNALGFQGVLSAELLAEQNIGSQVRRLKLGGQCLELVALREPCSPCPSGIAANDLRFQHLAIVVSDMSTAYDRLCSQKGWSPITRSGPQRLPVRSGGVSAFKFRDPEGHPLELLALPSADVPGRRPRDLNPPFIGIDHSAISVADTQRSIDFYSKWLGFAISGQSLNTGSEQGDLDNLDDPVVEVTSLSPGDGDRPHLELLCYRHPRPSNSPPAAGCDLAATKVVIETEKDVLTAISNHIGRLGDEQPSRGNVTDRNRPALLIRDPDGHVLTIRTHE